MATTEQRPAQTILVVEDEDAIRTLLATLLRQHGYVVLTAQHGQEALDLLASAPPPDLILLDMLMPVMDGWNFLDRLQAGRHRSVSVVVITGGVLGREWTDAHGCAGFLQKPFDAEDLLAEVRRCLPPG
jgi:CheY-like chemotaxis protein